jgi:hypothetical protein
MFGDGVAPPQKDVHAPGQTITSRVPQSTDKLQNQVRNLVHMILK